ncbi:hypothetical protein C8Q77DRAFT_301182 [Trametes polyzona]|nr:hypothetical protein C8Q77DRAFT_301182 [Trametes polyzona]
MYSVCTRCDDPDPCKLSLARRYPIVRIRVQARRQSRMAVLAYVPHVLYSTALTSLAMHHLYQRKTLEADRAHVAAQLSILADLRARLAAGERVPERELDRLWRLARSHDVWRARAEAGERERREEEERGAGGEEIGWKEVLFGKRFESARTAELDRRDLERGSGRGELIARTTPPAVRLDSILDIVGSPNHSTTTAAPVVYHDPVSLLTDYSRSTPDPRRIILWTPSGGGE